MESQELQRRRLADHHQRTSSSPASIEVVTDEGFLRSPYRSVRFFIDPFIAGPPGRDLPEHAFEQCGLVPREVLPRRTAPPSTRMYRFYTDTWGVIGHTGELGYVHPARQHEVGRQLDLRSAAVRYYTQTNGRLLPGHLPARRLRELHGARQGTRDLQRVLHAGASATYEFKIERFPGSRRARSNMRYDRMQVNYDDFRDARFSLGSFGNLPAEPFDPGTELALHARREHLPVLHQRVLLARAGVLMKVIVDATIATPRGGVVR